MPAPSNMVIGIAGGSGSGKTTLARALRSRLAALGPVLLHQDSYYKHTPERAAGPEEAPNYDHPDAFDTALLVKHLADLKRGAAVDRPVYDFVRHTRAGSEPVAPSPVIILEGILVLAEPEIRDALDLPLYVDTPDDVRFVRRLRRDVDERGRTRESVYRQYVATVRPMHYRFVEPSKRYARLIVPGEGHDDLPADLIASYVLRRYAPNGV